LARRASAIEKLRTQGHGTLIVDAGDALLQNPLAPQIAEGDLNKAEAIMRAQAMAGVELMAVGEAEVAVGISRLEQWALQTSQTLLCANVTHRGGRAPFKPHAMIQTGGVKVGVTSVLELPAREKAGLELLKRARLRVGDPIQAAKREVKTLRASGAELVVLLAHVGADRIRELAKVQGINLIIGAHAGHMYSLPMHEGTTYYVEPGRRGQMLGHVQLRLGVGWTPDTPLVDDSPRHVLYSEARHELDELAKGKGRRLTKSDPRLARAVSLVNRLRTTPEPTGPHRIIAKLVTLDQAYADNPAIKGLLDASRATWINKPPKGVRPLPRGIQRVRRAPIQIEQ